VREPLKVRVEDESHAIALTRELADLRTVDLQPCDGAWEVSIEGLDSDRLIVRVLDAVRQILGASPDAAALVLLDGREYRLDGR
jgi:hypothetical protein